MTIRIDGTNTTANPGITGADADTGLQLGTNELKLVTGGTEAVTVDSSQNVGIGTDNPEVKLHVNGGNLQVENSTGNNITLKTAVNNGNDSTFIFQKSRGGSGAIADVVDGDDLGTISWGGYYSGAFQNTSTIRGEAAISGSYGDRLLYDSDQHLIRTNNTTRLTVNADGHIRFAQDSTNTPGLNNTTTGLGIEHLSSGAAVFISRSDNQALFLNLNQNGNLTSFRRSGNQVGTISVTTTNTAFNTSGSDRRLKKNFEDWTDSVLPAFRNLNPQKFHFNTQEDTEDKIEGYIAQDLAEHFPDAYPLSKVDIDGEEVERYMFNPSGMVVYLMKALQEATLEIDTLKTKVAALENA